MSSSPWNIASRITSGTRGFESPLTPRTTATGSVHGLWLLRGKRTGPGVAAVETLQLQRLPDGGLIRSQRMARLEAALLISGQAVSAKRLAQLAQLEDAAKLSR